MSILAQLVIALALFAGGLATGIKWQIGVVAQRDLAAAELRQADQREQRITNDIAAGQHATRLASLNTQLGDAHARIAHLSDRQCLGADAVRLLNDIGGEPVRAAASDPAGAPAATAGDRHDGHQSAGASERDVATALATCRTRYAEVSSQLNGILDIEDRRHTPGAPGAP